MNFRTMPRPALITIYISKCKRFFTVLRHQKTENHKRDRVCE